MHPKVTRGGLLLLLIAAEFIGGKLGLLLAIPPGFATAVWPPSGIALAGLLLLGRSAWPAVFIGSFLINISTSGHLSAQSLAVAAAIATGSALQALLGEGLIRRCTSYQGSLARSPDVVRILALSGPVACLVSATVGTITLAAAGLLPISNTVWSWFTWYAGDSVGVAVFMPVVLILFEKQKGSWPQRLAILVPLISMISLVVLAYVMASRAEALRTRNEFDNLGRDVARNFKESFQSNVEVVHALAAYYRNSQKIEPREFDAFAGTLLVRHPSVVALSYSVAVTARERAAFEAEGKISNPSFQITEFGEDRTLRRAANRPVHLVVQNTTACVPNKHAEGFDVLSEENRRTAVMRAISSNEAVATKMVRLIRSAEFEDGILIFLPLKSGKASRLQERLIGQMGVIAGVMRAGPMLDRAVQIAGNGGVTATFRDSEPRSSLIASGTPSTDKQALRIEVPIKVGGRTWILEAVSTSTFAANHSSWDLWAVLAIGMVMTGILGAFLLVIGNRNEAVASLVHVRTSELLSANQTSEVQRGHLITLTRELESALEAKDRFLSNVSHEVRTPLSASYQFLTLVLDEVPGKLNDVQREYLQISLRNLDELTHLVSDLLDVSRSISSKMHMELSPCDLGNLIEETVRSFALEAEERNLTLEFEVTPGLPLAMIDPSRTRQVLSNLIVNALKFTPSPGSVRVTTSCGENELTVCVADTGVGVPAVDRDLVFDRLYQLSTKGDSGRRGLGLGLAISKEIAEGQGGRIWVESVVGVGSSFSFTVPISAIKSAAA